MSVYAGSLFVGSCCAVVLGLAGSKLLRVSLYFRSCHSSSGIKQLMLLYSAFTGSGGSDSDPHMCTRAFHPLSHHPNS